LKPVLTNLENTPGQQPVETPEEMPVWMRRVFLIIYVLFCIEVGIVMVALPWTPLWSNNNLLAHWPSVRHVLEHGFVRGAVSGLGFVDLWFAIAEAVNYRERR
jgi:hypothetical protein